MICFVWRSRLLTMSANAPAREFLYSLFPVWVTVRFRPDGQGSIGVSLLLTCVANRTAHAQPGSGFGKNNQEPQATQHRSLDLYDFEPKSMPKMIPGKVYFENAAPQLRVKV
jgi:hypothetical protein